MVSMACIGCAGSGTTGGTTGSATDKDRARALEDLGTAFVRQGNLRAALEKLLEAEKFDPENAYIKQELAQVFRDLGDYQKALEYFEQALTLKPRFPEVQNNLGALYILLKEWDLAIEYCQKAADDLLYKTPHFAYTNLGTAHYFKGNSAMAIRSFQQALKLAPEYSPAYFGLGYVYEASAFFRVGKIYRRLNRIAEAEEALRHFLELVPEGPEADEARGLLGTK
jgi:type IV pilus biogenesis/stability protein PilW